MKKETDQRELSPAELWDQLAVTTIKKQLAPTGYKKVYKGKSEVANIQFLGKQTVNQTCLIGANLVRLFRENLKDHMKEQREACQKIIAIDTVNIDKAPFWKFRFRRKLEREVIHYEAQAVLLDALMKQVDNLKPSNPKPAKKK